MPSGKSDFSRVVACRCTQGESTKEQQRRLQQSSGLDLPLLKRMTFDNFDWKRVNLPPEQRENLKDAFNEALEFAKLPEGWLVLSGATGCGKTHLAAAIGNYRLKLGQMVKFQPVPELLDHLRSTFSPNSEVSYDQLFRELENIPLLILDDFWEHTTTEWTKEKLYQLITHRYNHCLATVFTTTRSLDEITDERIVSRLFDYQSSLVFNIMAPDYRSSRKPRAQHRARK